MRPGVRIGLGLRLRGRRRLLAFRGRKAGVVRRLGRQAQLGFQFGHPRRQRRDLRHQPGDQRILLVMREKGKVGAAGHAPVDSDSSPPRQPFPTPESIRRTDRQNRRDVSNYFLGGDVPSVVRTLDKSRARRLGLFDHDWMSYILFGYIIVVVCIQHVAQAAKQTGLPGYVSLEATKHACHFTRGRSVRRYRFGRGTHR